ncbi:hypothetical protein IU433_27090 [Nocardia puris]|uniref:WXG100 family type VII secretion target n=1 Tax=Nocardia puris TaxID=208602 RepID=UPI0018953FA5|nr:hypothetical protein [Nocardia puris]MBF6213059.1 hypothetical protein [Nocardia puris]MBF6368050.1 hypothetical protein [Nocardia puris]MBF6462683.1 hypothetical protein [Nocardia puris]
MAATTVWEAFSDPFGFAGGQVAGWMLTHVEPLRKTLDALAGNDEMIAAYSETWGNIAEELTEMARNWDTGLKADISTWTGDAGDAYRYRAGDLVDQIGGASGAAASMGEAMELIANVVKAFRKLVQDILSSLLGALIGYTIELAVTFGAAAMHVAAAAQMRIARDGVRVSMIVADMGKALLDIKPLTEAVGAVLNAILGKENQPGQTPA